MIQREEEGKMHSSSSLSNPLEIQPETEKGRNLMKYITIN
jgi:hypothetical protein